MIAQFIKKIGDEVIICYDPTPLGKYRECKGVVKKITPKGFLRIEDEDGRSELYNPYTGIARGWNTLWIKK